MTDEEIIKINPAFKRDAEVYKQFFHEGCLCSSGCGERVTNYLFKVLKYKFESFYKEIRTKPKAREQVIKDFFDKGQADALMSFNYTKEDVPFLKEYINVLYKDKENIPTMFKDSSDFFNRMKDDKTKDGKDKLGGDTYYWYSETHSLSDCDIKFLISSAYAQGYNQTMYCKFTNLIQEI